MSAESEPSSPNTGFNYSGVILEMLVGGPDAIDPGRVPSAVGLKPNGVLRPPKCGGVVLAHSADASRPLQGATSYLWARQTWRPEMGEPFLGKGNSVTQSVAVGDTSERGR
jgi:hypothetical protein